MSCSSSPAMLTATSRPLWVVTQREATPASTCSRSSIRHAPSRRAIEEGTARIAGRMNSRTSDSETAEPELHLHPCASRGRLDSIAAPQFHIRRSGHSRPWRGYTLDVMLRFLCLLAAAASLAPAGDSAGGIGVRIAVPIALTTQIDRKLLKNEAVWPVIFGITGPICARAFELQIPWQ